MPFRLTHSGHKLATCYPPSHCLHRNHSLSSQGALRCPAESTVSHYDRSDSSVTLHSLCLLFVSATSSSIFSSAFLMLLFQSSAISLSIPVWIPSFRAWTLFFSNPLCPHLTFVWQCFCLGVSPCYLCVPCISVGVLSCMSLSCTDRCLYSSSPQWSGGTPAQKLGSKRSRLTIVYVFFF